MNAELIINDFKRNKISKEDAKSQLFELVIDNEISNDDFLRITHDMDAEAIEYDKKINNLILHYFNYFLCYIYLFLNY